MPKIHAAANRIPTLRTDEQLRHFPELQDRKPLPLDHLPTQTWCGSIKFSITAKTPLVYGNVDEETRSISIPTEILDGFGDTPREIPVLPATMVKGMLSNAFERVTTSRLRIFGNYSDPLTYRTDPAASPRLIPAIVNPKENKARLLTGTHPRLEEIVAPAKFPFRKKPQTIPVMRAATLRTKPGKRIKFAPGMTHKKLLHKICPKNGAVSRKIRFDAKLIDNRHYAYWLIYALYSDEDNKREQIFDENTLPGEDLGETLTKQEGYVYLTTDPEDLKQHRATHEKKVSERVFFTENEHNSQVVAIPHATTDHPSPIDRYLLTLQSYVNNWIDELERDPKTTRTPNRFIRQQKVPHLKPRSSFLAYVLVSKDLYGDATVDSIVPISIGRDAYALSPLTVARHANVAPPQILPELSPADRLFGFVGHSDDTSQDTKEKSNPAASFKGRIFVTKVDYAGGGGLFYPSTLRLRPLLSPRPSSARRFLTRVDGANINSASQQVKRSQYFSVEPEQSLGATTYPVDRNAWVNIDQTTGLPKKAIMTPEDARNVTTSVVSYLKAGTTFKVTLRFEAMSKFELSWLIWLLNPANLAPRAEANRPGFTAKERPLGYLRLGTGKPLGLGVVQVELVKDGFEAIESSEDSTEELTLSSAYRNLSGCLGTACSTTDSTTFEVSDEYLDTPWVKAFQRASFGYEDQYEVRHLTLEENQVNNKTNGRSGLPLSGHGVEPGALWGARSGDPIEICQSRCSHR